MKHLQLELLSPQSTAEKGSCTPNPSSILGIALSYKENGMI